MVGRGDFVGEAVGEQQALLHDDYDKAGGRPVGPVETRAARTWTTRIAG